jgi:hypothetical protein
MRIRLAPYLSAAEMRDTILEHLRELQQAPRLALAIGVITGVVVVSAHGYAQPWWGMPNNLGPAAQTPQTTATVRRVQTSTTSAQTTRPVRRPQKSAIAQHVRTGSTGQRAQSSAPVQSSQTKSMPPRTVGARTVAKPAKPAIEKAPVPVPVLAKIATPVLALELLAPPSEPDCAFDKTRADADDRQKLDYERQCYRHAEMIIRARLERLQGDVERMIKAVKRGESLSDSR